MKLLFLLPLFLGLANGDDHPSTNTSTHTSTLHVSTSSHHLETEHTSTMPASSTGYSYSNGMLTTTIRPSSTGVVCRPLDSTGSHSSLTAFCPILSAHQTHTGMMGGGGMMGSEYECPDYEGSGFHYTMNMMGSDPMCCTYSATLTRVGSSVGCCPCGSICTGTVPRTQNWYTAAGTIKHNPLSPRPPPTTPPFQFPFEDFEGRGVIFKSRDPNIGDILGQVVLTTGSVPSTVTVTTTPVGSGGSHSLHGSAAYLNLPFVAGSVILTVLIGGRLFI